MRKWEVGRSKIPYNLWIPFQYRTSRVWRVSLRRLGAKISWKHARHMTNAMHFKKENVDTGKDLPQI